MTFDEAKQTMDIFCSDVKPELEAGVTVPVGTLTWSEWSAD